MGELVIRSVDNGITLLRLNDPATLNALSYPMAKQLRDALLAAERESRAVVLCAAGRGFCSGANLSDSGISPDTDFDAGAMLQQFFHPLMNTIRDLRIPIVSAVRGVAAGIGAPLALAADIIVAGQSAYFSQAFRHIGLIPDGGSAYILARAVGRVRAMELMLLGEKLEAPKALEWGLITRVVADDEVEPYAEKVARELAAGPGVALGLIRRIAWQALESDWQEILTQEREMQRTAGMTADFKEGVTAFMQKRRAKFIGR